MTDKKTFGAFIKAKRMEKNYSQKELADLLFISEGAISKWERGASYPDITLIADICRVLDISEHEFITASTDTAARAVQEEARKFRRIRNGWFWIPTIAYGVALLTCFICNLAVNHTLSWFFVVAAALICAFMFIPTITSFASENKLLVFTVSSYLSICLLLFTCGMSAGQLFWVPTACVGTLMGYACVFLPILLSRTHLRRYAFLLTAGALCLLTLILLLLVRLFTLFPLWSAWLIAVYAFAPLLICAAVCLSRLDGFIKAALSIGSCTVVCYFCNYLVNWLFGLNANPYTVDFQNWAEHTSGNVWCITLLALGFLIAVFLVLGLCRTARRRK